MVSVSVSKNSKILVSEKVLVSVSKNFGIKKSIGFGIGKIWYQNKYRIRYRKKLASEKSFGFVFFQILGFVTHCSRDITGSEYVPNLPPAMYFFHATGLQS